MKIVVIALAVLLGGCQQADISQLLEQYLWQKCVLLVFTPDIESSLLKEQSKMLAYNAPQIKERDLVTWVLVDGARVEVDGEGKPQLPTRPFYKEFGINKEDFAVILIGKDGEEKLRLKNQLLQREQLFMLIDSMPMRKREMQGVK